MADTHARPASDWEPMELMDLVQETYILQLYIAGLTPKSVAAWRS
jgi:hypothetical protein